jgi:hypothetical protein
MAKRWESRDTVRFLVVTIVLICVVGVLYAIVEQEHVVWVWVFAMLAVAIDLAFVGKGVRDVWYGVLVGDRNQISLSNLQVYLWFTVILSGWLFLALSNDTVRITVPEQVLGLLGISSVTTVAAVGINGQKKNAAATPAAGNAVSEQLDNVKEELKPEDPNSVDRRGVLVIYNDPTKASLGDLFTGDEVGNALSVDPGKVQMFFFTLLVAIAYASQVGYWLTLPEPGTALPDLSAGMVALLGISHVGYLGTKYAPSTRTQDIIHP